ncbi:MAG: pyridoxal phosphate-dependent aminotransferase [Lachnospiraceae bacterium]|nr:pyridoxal phosphate-dependent aminotransferase [Lachnospiraceae bacterium]
MKYNFDKEINRYNSNSLKYDCARERGVPKDALPMWVADMDFETAPEILKAMHESVNFGIFGYSVPKKEYYETVIRWFSDYFGWNPKAEWIVKTPGVVFAISVALRALTQKGDAVLIQQPVYYPFRAVIEDNERVCVNNPLVCREGHYEMDFEDMERKIIENDVKLFILCSPHNPVGRVWSREELIRVIDICRRYNVFIISDEIHCDFTYPGHVHTVLALLAEDYLDKMIICTSPSKSFNLAGLQLSHIFIPDRAVRGKFKKELSAVAYDESGTLALVAAKAAYESGGEWLAELKQYLFDNLKFLRGFLSEYMPKVKLIGPEGTYLVWLDFSACVESPEELKDKMLNEAKLWLDDGTMFGEEGACFERINIACPRTILIRALEQMKDVFGK